MAKMIQYNMKVTPELFTEEGLHQDNLQKIEYRKELYSHITVNKKDFKQIHEKLLKGDIETYFNEMKDILFRYSTKYLIRLKIISWLYNKESVEEYKQESFLKLWIMLKQFDKLTYKGTLLKACESKTIFSVLCNRMAKAIQTRIERDASVNSQRYNKFCFDPAILKERDELNHWEFRKRTEEYFSSIDAYLETFEDKTSFGNYYNVIITQETLKNCLTVSQMNLLKRVHLHGTKGISSVDMRRIGLKLENAGISKEQLVEYLNFSIN